MILEAPAGVLVKRGGSLGEACALSLSLLFMADPLSHLHTSPLLSLTLGCPVSILVPGAGGGASRAQPKSDDTGSPECPMRPGGSRV